jgi:transcriptional regulator with XRE-family HTH domain
VNNVREYRKGQGLTIEELAELADLTPSKLSRLERGQAPVDLHEARRIAKALRLRLEAVFPDQEKATV